MFNKIVDSNQTNKSSMAFDVQYKRKTEVDFISGVVSSLGKKTWNKNSIKRFNVQNDQS
jgi:2-dehydropantoate 2-reductase